VEREAIRMPRDSQPDMFSDDPQSRSVRCGADSGISSRHGEGARAAAQDSCRSASGEDVALGADAGLTLPDHLPADVLVAAGGRERATALRVRDRDRAVGSGLTGRRPLAAFRNATATIRNIFRPIVFDYRSCAKRSIVTKIAALMPRLRRKTIDRNRLCLKFAASLRGR
jgi:hypothetical protein